ncbi:hypothetical protein ABET51_01280 [Metabacillus fastidiosus]|uniref:hypothetical protein n=1 Tax=Metabacillus fastidiosus TaxID=1458 RepID=UPI002E1A54C5|nr:hypothetical protein [Metabacillus fastidiosus]
MLLKIFMGIIASSGVWLMGFSIFGKKKHFDNMPISFTFNLFEVLFDLIYNFSPSLIKRLLAFLIGLVTSLIFIIGIIYS